MIEINYDEINKQLKLRKENEEFFSSKGLVITGGNADGKTVFLNNQMSYFKNDSQLIRVNSKKKDKNDIYSDIHSHYIKLLKSDESGEIDLESQTFTGLYDFIKSNEDVLLGIIEKKVLNKEIFFDNGFEDFKYTTEGNNEITSKGETNLIELFILVSYYAVKESKIIFFIDEPNTNLDDEHSSELVNNLIKVIYEYFNKKILVIATTNNENILEDLEDFLVYNVKTNEVCYSNDLIGNREALRRITSNFSSQGKLLSENRRLLSDTLLNKKGFYMRDKEFIIFTESKISNSRYKILKYINLSLIEKNLFDKIYTLSEPASYRNFIIFDDYAEEG